jgi:hypothetical protein
MHSGRDPKPKTLVAILHDLGIPLDELRELI